MPKDREPTRTPNSSADEARNFRNGCLFLVAMVLLLWLFIFLFWTRGCTVNPITGGPAFSIGAPQAPGN